MKIQESAEMYLETIYILSKKQENVRSIDIARKMNFSKPSVSRAVKNLQSENYIDIDSNGFITLASNGLAIAKKIYERHEVFTQILVSLGVDPEIAEEDACRIEHVVSDETFRVIKKHLKEKGS
ncbi:MAG: metal-dependent transcriptional regulator [Erysipelotrichaceae bacterium]|nr:metal-dependent transcriptional regulator [Erysipelotrichaceae bacterium]